MPDAAPLPADDPFVGLLWRPDFIRQVRIASKAVIPMMLRSEHDDLIQEALIRAYNARLTYKGSDAEDLLKWVLVILRNLSRDKAEKRSREPDFEPLPVDEAAPNAPAPAIAPGPTEEDALLPPNVSAWMVTARGLFKCLSPNDQEILKLRLGSNFSVAETARILGISEGAVKMRFGRSFRRIVELAKKARLSPGGPRRQAKPGWRRPDPASESGEGK